MVLLAGVVAPATLVGVAVLAVAGFGVPVLYIKMDIV